MKDKILNIIAMSKRMVQELEAIRIESRRSDLSKTSKEYMAENIKKISPCLDRVHVLLSEMVDVSVEENINLEYHERKLIVGALKQHNGSRIHSARDLKISEKSVRNKIREHKISLSEYASEKPHSGREALSVHYRDDYNKMISYVNEHNTFWLKDLRTHMGYKEYYSPAWHLIDYLRTKNIIQCAGMKGREMKYVALRNILTTDLIFVRGNGAKIACVA